MYKILLVDDEYMILAGLSRLINWEEKGFEIVGTAQSAQEALTFIQENEVDFVITDVNMPDMSGIAFIEEAQKEGYHFPFVILSGYQEFEYVKSGLQLGAENYLLKPVDKRELIVTVEKVRQNLIDGEAQIKNETLLLEHMLQRWVTDDVTEVELKKVLHQLGHPLKYDDSYSVMVFEELSLIQERLLTLIEENEQDYFYITSDEHFLVLVFKGNENMVTDFIQEVRCVLPEDGWFLGTGELVFDLTDVYQSFNHAFYAVGMNDFYQGSEPFSKSETTLNTISFLPHFSFDNFSKALLIRDFETIQKEIQQILSQLKIEEVHPNYVRHIVFLLFMDIYRQFETLNEDFYQLYAKKIGDSTSFSELEILILNILIEAKNVKGVRRYSENVEESLKIIHTRYQENLNLKLVAEGLFLNVMYLGQLFKKETQKSFSQYLNHYRIKKAQNLLIHSNLTVNEIAYKIGYTSSGYFYKNFKKICGLSPSDFREEFSSNYQPLDE